MVKLTYKYQTLPINNHNKQHEEQLFINAKNNQEVNSTDYSMYVCIAVYIIYILLFLYLYSTAYYKNGITIFATEKKSYTLSESFQYSEKRGATILIVLCIGVLQYLFNLQNFYGHEDYQRTSVIAITYIILTSWVLLLFVWPKEEKFHSFIALLILISSILISTSVNSLYHEYYRHEELQNMQNITYVIIITFCLCILVMVIHAILLKSGYRQSVTKHLIGIFELLSISSFSIFILIFGILPPLPNKGDFVCYLK